MISRSQHTSLKLYNTFGINAKTNHLVIIESEEELRSVLSELQGQQFMILGGGSNVLFVNDYNGTIILNRMKGRELVSQSEDTYLIAAASGENWHDFVLWTIDHGYYGIENLSLIPGTVGASPMQNIGAYGVEIKDVFHHLEAMEVATGEIRIFSKEDCAFGYRESVFKRALRDQYVITKVYFQLSANAPLQTHYGMIAQELENKGITNPNHRDVSNAVIAIRSSKLPDPNLLGNAGSFFKNPIVDPSIAEALKSKHPDVPSFPDKNGTKIPAGWLIEKSGFKGMVSGQTGSHKDQALVIVNYGSATGKEIYEYATRIISEVRSNFGIELEIEVNLIY